VVATKYLAQFQNPRAITRQKGFCKDGYVGSSLTGCVLADFCLSGVHKCDTNANCIYTGPEEYKCEVGNFEIKQLIHMRSQIIHMISQLIHMISQLIHMRSQIIHMISQLIHMTSQLILILFADKLPCRYLKNMSINQQMLQLPAKIDL
jgi:hypothetical protein